MYFRSWVGLHVVLGLSLVFLLGMSVTKGWWLFLLIPALLVGFPLLWVFQGLANRWVMARTARGGLAPAAIVQLVSLLAAVTCVVGFGDTDEVFLFGGTSADVDDPITHVSTALCVGFFGIFLVASVWFLVAFLVTAVKAGGPSGVHPGVDPSSP